jgi:hypothetical protein
MENKLTKDLDNGGRFFGFFEGSKVRNKGSLVVFLDDFEELQVRVNYSKSN